MFLSFLEDDNLFKIHLVDEDEIQLKKLKLESIEHYKHTEAAIEEVNGSLALMEKTRDLVMERFKYLSTNINQNQEQGKNIKKKEVKVEAEEAIPLD